MLCSLTSDIQQPSLNQWTCDCGSIPERSRLRPLESCRKDTSPTTRVTGRPRPKAYLQTQQGHVTMFAASATLWLLQASQL